MRGTTLKQLDWSVTFFVFLLAFDRILGLISVIGRILLSERVFMLLQYLGVQMPPSKKISQIHHPEQKCLKTIQFNSN